jgi:predicted RNA methylase
VATDVKKIIDNLFQFYEFNDQTVISVGAGGGQFIEYGRNSRHVIAIDSDDEALKRLENALQKLPFKDKFTLIHSDFYEANMKGDVVLFEFCLHEMKNAETAINHALTMAPDILIADHWPDSEWAYIVDEKDKVTNSWEVVKKFKFKRIRQYNTFQFFRDYEELFLKVHTQGENSIKRIDRYRAKKNFTIPMSYGFALI